MAFDKLMQLLSDRQAQQEQERLEEQKHRKAVMEKSLREQRRILEELMSLAGIEIEAMKQDAPVCYAGGFSFSLQPLKDETDWYWPLLQKSYDTYVPREQIYRMNLVVENLALNPIYRARVPGRRESYAQYTDTIYLNGPIDGDQFCLVLAKIIYSLQESAERAPEKKQRLDVEYEQQERARREREEQQAREKAEREAELERQRAEWDAQYAAEEAEREQARQEREAKEAAYRAALAERFGLPDKPEAFDYLVRTLADEIERRRSCEY